MPRPSKGPRLALFKAKGRNTVWNIRDGKRTLGTGCAQSDRATAERKLGEYIARKHNPRASQRNGNPNSVKIADALSVYLSDRTSPVVLDRTTGEPIKDKKTGKTKPNPDLVARPKALIKMVLTLGEFFGERTVGELNGDLQKDFVNQRGFQSAARRELEVLGAAVNHHVKDMVGGVQTLFRPVLPDAAPARDRWLTRSEAARLMWAAWRKREHRGGREAGRYTSRHIARFILVGLYSGSRAGAICGAALVPTIGRGYINVETGEFRRLAYGKTEPDNKKAPTVELPPRLMAHIRRWHRKGIARRAVVEFAGEPVMRINKGWDGVIEKAGLATDIKELKVLPHTLRHTAITWYLKKVPVDKVSKFCGVSAQIIKAHYGHHIPDDLASVHEASRDFGRPATVTQQKRVQQA